VLKLILLLLEVNALLDAFSRLLHILQLLLKGSMLLLCTLKGILVILQLHLFIFELISELFDLSIHLLFEIIQLTFSLDAVLPPHKHYSCFILVIFPQMSDNLLHNLLWHTHLKLMAQKIFVDSMILGI